MLSIGYVSKLAATYHNFSRLFSDAMSHGMSSVSSAIFLMLIPTSAIAAQSLEEIHLSSINFLKQNLLIQGALPENVHVKVNQPDKRLRLAKCQQPLVNFLPEYAAHSGNTTVGVRCESPKWQIYLPAKVEHLIDVWMVKRSFRKGDTVTVADLQQVKRAKNKRIQAIQFESNSLTTIRASKNIHQGTVISNGDLCQICKGDQIELRVKSAALTVKMYGIALKNGLQGDLVTARNNKSKKMITGKVVAPGILEMTI